MTFSEALKTYFSFFWWKKLDLIAVSKEEHRQASWIDLFFDLTVVACVGKISHVFAENISFMGFFYLLFSFLTIWFIWQSIVIYANSFESFSLKFRISMLANMIPLSIIAIVLPIENFEEPDIYYALAFVSSRILIGFTWYSGAKDSKNNLLISTSKYFNKVYIISSLLTLSSYFVMRSGYPSGLFLWGLAVIIEVFSLVLPNKNNFYSIDLHPHYFKERFGLLTMLILGELLLSCINGAAEIQNEHGLQSILIFIVSFIFVALLWWLYFDFVINREISNPVYWSLCHIPISLSLLMISSLLLEMLNHYTSLLPEYRLWIVISLIIFNFSIFIIYNITKGWQSLDFKLKDCSDKKFILAIIFSLFILGFLGFINITSSMLFLLILICILASNLMVGFYLWIKSEEEHRT